MVDVILHILLALAMFSVMVLTPVTVAATLIVWITFLLRELAQKDPHNVIAAAKSIPTWSVQKHMEWFAPGAAVYCVGLFCRLVS